jgi:hypothetical protein
MAIQTNNLAVGTASIGGATPDYTPPAFQWKSADELTIKSGRYYQGGYRLDGQYQDTTGLQSYWDVTAFDVDIDGASQIGGDVADSWYSVFLTAADAVVILPCIRVDAIDYNVSNAGKTTINPADIDDGTSANNNYVSANDVFNGYRLLLLSDTAYHGSLYTIEDSVDGTPDEVVIDGDVSAEIAATEHLQMIPASGTACVFLGWIRLDSSGDLVQVWRDGWNYQLPSRFTVNGVCNTSAANTDLSSAIPPTAKRILVGLKIAAPSAVTGTAVNVYRGISGSDICEQSLLSAAPSSTYLSALVTTIPLSAVAKIRNSFQVYNGSWIAANEGDFQVTGFSE